MASLAFGGCWVLIGGFDPIGLYTGWLAQALWGTAQPPPEALKTFAFMALPLGATTAGYFVMLHMIQRCAFPRREPWAAARS